LPYLIATSLFQLGLDTATCSPPPRIQTTTTTTATTTTTTTTITGNTTAAHSFGYDSSDYRADDLHGVMVAGGDELGVVGDCSENKLVVHQSIWVTAFCLGASR
jgi:hypothetical protein